jgi:hypothetical protein
MARQRSAPFFTVLFPRVLCFPQCYQSCKIDFCTISTEHQLVNENSIFQNSIFVKLKTILTTRLFGLAYLSIKDTTINHD